MALDVRTRARAEEAEVDHTLGGTLLVWLAGLALGLGFFVVGLRLAPEIGGFLLMIASGLLAGVSYTEVMLRLPTMTHRFTLSLLLTLLVAAVIVVGFMLYGQSLPTATAPGDVMLLPARG